MIKLVCRMIQLLVAGCKRVQMMSQMTETTPKRPSFEDIISDVEVDDVEEQDPDETLEELRRRLGLSTAQLVLDALHADNGHLLCI